MKFYSQAPTFELTEHGIVDVQEAMELVRAFPTLPEVKSFREQRDACRPLIGFEDELGAFVEFSFRDDGSYHCRFEQPYERRVLGIGIMSRREIDAASISIDVAETLVRAFFAKDWDAVYERMKNESPA